ncbi:MAG: hypothetical protein ACR2ME_09625 [Acidimicrobiia bacterium]
MRVILEIGKKRKVVGGAVDWPGLDRSGNSEEEALAKLAAYRLRYVAVAERADLANAFKRAGAIEVVERLPGSSSTDFWGIAQVPSELEHEVLAAKRLERRLALLDACWSYFDKTAKRVSAELRPGPRGGGRERGEIINHVYASERSNWSPKVEVRTPAGVMINRKGLTRHRQEFLDAIRAYNAEGKPARKWPIQFLVRRTAQHVMDHAWEMEDRDLSPNGAIRAGRV